jgi:uncharacterized protein YfbU (UPF0304 family)
MSIIEELQQKASELPESTAAEVLDFLEFVSHRSKQRKVVAKATSQKSVRGSLQGRLSTSQEFAAAKKHEIVLEQ